MKLVGRICAIVIASVVSVLVVQHVLRCIYRRYHRVFFEPLRDYEDEDSYMF